MVKVAASILAANFSQQGADLVKNADIVHIDVMDGEFVSQKTVWTEVVIGLETNLPKDVHLMVMNPEEYVEEFIDAGAAMVSFHIESTDVPEAVIGLIQAKGAKAGITLKPGTHIDMIKPYLDSVDFVLVMSVEPGKGGQGFKEEALQKVIFLRNNYPNLDIEIDGGINEETAKKAIDVGANILVVGTYLFTGTPEEQISKLKNL